MTTTSTTRIVAVFDDPHALNHAVHLLEDSQVSPDDIEIQQGRDRSFAARGRPGSTGPTRPVEDGSRAVLALGLALSGALVGALIGAIVFMPFDIAVLPTWAEILVFAAIGAIAASTYAFVMAAGSGPEPSTETDERRTDRWMTMSVNAPARQREALHRLLRDLGAVRVVERL